MLFKSWDEFNEKYRPWATTGDKISIKGVFRKRTFLEWLTRAQRELIEFEIIGGYDGK